MNNITEEASKSPLQELHQFIADCKYWDDGSDLLPYEIVEQKIQELYLKERHNQLTVHGIWICPTEKPDNAENLHWRWNASKNKVDIYFVGNEPYYKDLQLSWDKLQYLHEGAISEELAMKLAEEKYLENFIMCTPSESNHNMGGTCDVNYYERQAYASALTSLVVSVPTTL